MLEGQEPTRFTMPAGLAELQAELEQTWPAYRTALRASGVPLNEGETDEEKAAREKAEADAAAAAKKPWGDDADFDPEKAWKLITNLRADVDKVKGDRDELRTKVTEHENASKTEQEKAAERAATAEKEAADAKRDAARLRVAVQKGLTETQAKRLVGDTEEELAADADELLETFKVDDGDGDGASTTRTRPKERLRSGATGDSEPDETDPAKLAAQVPRPY